MKSLFAKEKVAGDTNPHAPSAQRNLVCATLAVVVMCALLFFAWGGGSSGAAAAAAAADALRATRFPERFRIAVIADLDQKSKVKNAAGKDVWHSVYQTVRRMAARQFLFRTLPHARNAFCRARRPTACPPPSLSFQGTLLRAGQTYSVSWDAPVDLFTGHNEAGRGCELSELVLHHGHLLTFDDRTGIMFEVANFASSDAAGAPGGGKAGVRGAAARPPRLVPRQILMEGDGETDKGMKVEWATVRDDTLWVGSFGKEYTDSAGNILHANNLWVKTVSPAGEATSVNWEHAYGAMRHALGYDHPSYLLHEAVTWSPHRRQWFVLPRRISKEPYDEVADETKGSNVIIQAAPDWSRITSTTVGVRAPPRRRRCVAATEGPSAHPLAPYPPSHPPALARSQTITPLRGFSSFKFLPGSRDTVIVALKSSEDSSTSTQATFITIFGERSPGVWDVLLEETELPGHAKFEGIEIIEA